MIKRIAHITDLHLDEEFPFGNNTSARRRFDIILASVRVNGISSVVCTGDIGVNDGIQYFFEKLENMDLSITLGNHDDFKRIFKYYSLGADYSSGKIYKSEIQNGFKIIYLDSSSGNIDDKQFKWLKKEIKASRPIIIFVHHPIIGVELKVDEIGRLIKREDLIKVLEKVSNKIYIFCGHYHMEHTLIHRNIHQFITPAVAFQIEKDRFEIKTNTTISGYRIIQFDNNKVVSDVKKVDIAN